MNTASTRVLFLGKRDDDWTDSALADCIRCFPDTEHHLGDWDESLPADVQGWQGDYLISYLSRWVVPAKLLASTRKAALNFHPGPPAYPGIGCFSYALYDGLTEYGVTCHHMTERVDSGPIVAVRSFPILGTDDLDSLILKAYDVQLALFRDMLARLSSGEALPQSELRWTRAPILRREFDELGIITLDMPREEVSRRLRAMSGQAWRPTLEFHGHVFEHKPN